MFCRIWITNSNKYETENLPPGIRINRLVQINLDYFPHDYGTLRSFSIESDPILDLIVIRYIIPNTNYRNNLSP